MNIYYLLELILREKLIESMKCVYNVIVLLVIILIADCTVIVIIHSIQIKV